MPDSTFTIHSSISHNRVFTGQERFVGREVRFAYKQMRHYGMPRWAARSQVLRLLSAGDWATYTIVEVGDAKTTARRQSSTTFYGA